MPLIVSADDLRDVLSVGANTADETLALYSEAAQSAVLRYLKKKDDEGNVIDYSTVAGAHVCIMQVAVDTFMARKAPGGQASMLDVAPAPRINAFLVQRTVQSMLLDYMDAGGFVA